MLCQPISLTNLVNISNTDVGLVDVCGTLKCENASMCEKVANCENISTLNVKIDAICENITLNVKTNRLLFKMYKTF